MLHQRLLAGLLAVTTVTTTIAVNVFPSYGNNSTNVQYLVEVTKINWLAFANNVKSAIDLYQKDSQFGVSKKLLDLFQEANKIIDRGLGDQTVPPNKVRELRNNLKPSDFTTLGMEGKLRNLRNNL